MADSLVAVGASSLSRSFYMISAKLLQIEDRVFTEQRVRFYAVGVVIAYGLSLALLSFKRGWVTAPNGDIRGIDFGWIWLSGRLAASGEAAKVFDHAAFSAAQLTFYFPHLTSGSDYLFNRFYYPPTFLFFTYPFGLMSYVTACAVWIVVSLVLYEAALYMIISREATLIAAATPFFVIENIDFTHTGFITAGLMGLSLAFIKRRPLASGIFLGLLAYKPHFGLLFPLALLGSRNWRAFGSAAAATVALGVVAAIAFGWSGWASFIGGLGDRSSTLGPGEGEVRLFSIFGLLHWAGASLWLSWSTQLAVTAAVSLGTCVLWAKPIPYDLKAATLSVGSLLVSPYVLFFDLCILSVAAAFLVRDGLSRGFLPGERTAILLCWASLFIMQTPVGAIVSLVLMFLCIRRIVAHRKNLITAFQDAPLAHAVPAEGS